MLLIVGNVLFSLFLNLIKNPLKGRAMNKDYQDRISSTHRAENKDQQDRISSTHRAENKDQQDRISSTGGKIF